MQERVTTKSLRFAGAVMGIVALVYAPTLVFGFLNFDDPDLLTKHPFFQTIPISRWIEVWDLRHFFSGTLLDYSPVRDTSYLMDRWLFGWNSAGFHAVQVALHALNAGIVCLLLAFMFEAPLAALGALIWALHPVQVEPVAWISSRKDLLMGFFFFGTLGALRFEKKIAGGVSYGLSMLSKYTAVAGAPIIWAEKKLSHLKVSCGWIAASLAFAGVFAFVVARGNQAPERFLSASPHRTLGEVFPAVFQVPAWIFETLVVPSNLSARYVQHPEWKLGHPRILLGLVLVGVCGATLGMAWKRRPKLALGLSWIFLGFLPTLGQIILGHPVWMADRYFYLPLYGAVVVLLVAAEKLPLKKTCAILMIFCGALGYANLRRQRVWKTSVTLWEDTARKSPALYYVHGNLGAAYLEAGRYDEAEVALERSVKLNPAYGEGYLHLAQSELWLGKKQEAEAHMTQAERLVSERKKTFHQVERAVVYAMLGNPKASEALFLSHLERNPTDAGAWSNLASVYANYRQNPSALKAWDEALKHDPRHVATFLNRSYFWAVNQKCQEAENDLATLETLGAKAEPRTLQALKVACGR